MKNFILACVAFGLLLLGCNQSSNQNEQYSNNESTEHSADEINVQDRLDGDTNLDDVQIDSIKRIITLFEEGNVDAIANQVAFPLNRAYPIPAIQNREEFKNRFDEVFDVILIQRIANSEMSNWSEAGSNGIMFDNGTIWMASSGGMITAVNYQSDAEKKLRQKLIDAEKDNIHPSLKTFKNPVYRIKTANYRIRIDELDDHKYRYASWKQENDESSIPDLILDNGELQREGSGGNHIISFTHDNYVYKIHRAIVGTEDTPSIILEIEKDGRNILREHGELVIDTPVPPVADR